MSELDVVVDRTGRSLIDESGRSALAGGAAELAAIVSRNLVGEVPGIRFFEVGDLNVNSIKAAVAQLGRQGSIRRIATVSEYLSEPVAEIRSTYGIPGHSVEYANTLRDKWAMKVRAAERGIRHNPGQLASDAASGASLPATSAGYVLKPRAESGSKDVRTFGDWESVMAAVRKLRDPAGYLIEVFNRGIVLHIDGMVVSGAPSMQVSEYVRPCNITGGRIPLSSVTVADQATLAAVTEFMYATLKAFEVEDDVFHCEVFAAGSTITLCEIAGRPGGAGVPAVFRATRGVDLRHAKLRLDLALDPFADRGDPVASHGGWTVIYPPSVNWRRVDDQALEGHHTRSVLSPSDPWVDGLAGVGVATYSFADASVEHIRTLIDRYERGVKVISESGSWE